MPLRNAAGAAERAGRGLHTSAAFEQRWGGKGEGGGGGGRSKDSVQPDEHSAAAAAIHNSATPYPQYFTFKRAAGRPRMQAQDDQQRLYPSLLGVR
jgi:hypothetical protein